MGKSDRLQLEGQAEAPEWLDRALQTALELFDRVLETVMHERPELFKWLEGSLSETEEPPQLIDDEVVDANADEDQLGGAAEGKR